jgi:cobalt-zinc-cadmium efflux system outer membrane protein
VMSIPPNADELSMLRPLILLSVGFLAAGCAVPASRTRGSISADLERRTGYTAGTGAPASKLILPPGVQQGQPLTEEQVVLLALWNNAAFQELLVELQLTRADLIQAGLLPNPEFVYFFSAPDKPMKYLFDFPLEALWLRPIRVTAALGDAERASQRLTQAGLDLMRDTRQAYAVVVLARERLRVADEGVKLRGRIAELAAARLKAGDISEQEAATARIDALQAVQAAALATAAVPIAEELLRNLMGTGPVRGPIPTDPVPAPPCGTLDVDALAQEATTTRPDAVAAADFANAARARLDFAKIGWVRLLGIGDATNGNNGHVFGPGVRFTVPIFNRNQGNIARAEAELERAVRNQQTVAYQIILDVQRAYLSYRQACVELGVLRGRVRPEVAAAIDRAQAGYREGNTPIFVVLATTQQLLAADLREAELQADLRRFWAELERSTGHRVPFPAAEVPPTAAAPPAPPVTAPEKT